jgi:hypothetical protein
VDFGIAKLSGVETEVPNLTTAGEIFGSPYYMSPEHCDGKRIDARSDIYSLGCTFFEILTGVPPFRGANSIQTMMMHQSQMPPSLSKATGGKYFPEAMEEMVATMLEKAPMDRYQNLEEVVVDLEYMRKKAGTSSGSALNGDLEQGSAAGAKLSIQMALKICLAVAVLLATLGTVLYWLRLEAKKTSSDAKPANSSSSSSSSSSSPEATTTVKSGANVGSLNGAGVKPETVSVSKPGAVVEIAPESKPGSSAEIASDSANSLSAIGNVKPYFCGIVDDKGLPKRKFDFGSENKLGKLEIENNEEWIPASGEVFLPPKGKVTLHCSEAVIADPSLLEGFSSSDLYGLVFEGHQALDKSALRHIIRLSGLKYLSVSAFPCNFDGDSLSQIELLFDLKELELVDTRIKGSELATLSRIKKLRRLTYSPVTEPANLLKVLAPSKSLTELTLERGLLSLSDFKAISTCPNLRQLRVNETGMTNDCMAAISSLSRLKELRANPSLLDRDCLKSLKKLKNLQVLGIGGPKFDASDPDDFSKALGIQVN